jgi:hypothetical protein
LLTADLALAAIAFFHLWQPLSFSDEQQRYYHCPSTIQQENNKSKDITTAHQQITKKTQTNNKCTY